MNCGSSYQKFCGVKECQHCYQRSFATHARAAQWSPANPLKPHQVALNSNKKYLFDCDECGHTFDMPCNTVSKGQWCRYCNKGVLCENAACDVCFKRSFASHPMAAEWSSKNPVTAREVSIRSDRKV